MNRQQLENVAQFVVAEARRLGASDCDISIGAYESVDTGVRLGQVEKLEGAQGRELRFRAFVGKNSATTRTADFRRRSLTRMVRETVAMARASEPDEFAGLPARELLATGVPDLGLADAALKELPVGVKIDLAMQAEAAARAVDPRITNSKGAGFSDSRGISVYANSLGFLGSYEGTSCTLHATVVASENGAMQVGGWWSSSRKLAGLESAEAIGATAAAHALRQLGARKVASQVVPVVFDPQMAGRLLGQFASAAMGASIYRQASFLVGKLGQPVASKEVQIIDDGRLPGALGSRPFDAEGLPTGTRAIVADGVLQSYFLGSYAARKLGTAPNGGSITNLYMQAGKVSPEEIIRSVSNGLYLTNVSGPGFNVVTGDYSLGASGIWIENGQLAYPVEEITVAGNLLEMFASIEAIGSDLVFRSSVNAPTIKIARMTVAGK